MTRSTPKTNRAVWLSSYTSPAQIVELPMPAAGPGSAVVQVIGTYIPPYTREIHNGTLSLFNLFLPLVPNPSHIGRVCSTGPDAVKLKPGDLVFFSPWIKARDDRTVSIIQGHHGGEGPKGLKLMQGEWRDGSLQQYQKVPLEGLFLLNETRLCGELGYRPVELQDITLHSMAYAALIEAGKMKAGDTVIIGPSTGTFSATAVELALLLGANVVALGRNKEGLGRLANQLGDPDRLQLVVMTGNAEKDTAAILNATPDGEGAEVFNDWSSSTLQTAPYFLAAFGAVKMDGRVVLSGAPSANVAFPYTLAMHKNISVVGKMMSSCEAVEATIKLITSGILKVGEKGGAKVTTFSLEDHLEAEEYAANHGSWKNYTYVMPNSE